ncbi:hypothetical protein [Dyadobacter bucti]|uniref:hypothetical protein n=1 Tax=Dyadobacter bucti TaxID=2572203 RepID=UPI003F708C70
MKVVAYSIEPFEKEFLAKANQKKHDITLISNALTIQTADYAKGKDAVLVSASDDVSAPIINKLASLGVKYMASRSSGMDHIDQAAAASKGIRLANLGSVSPQPDENVSTRPHYAFPTTKALQRLAEQTVKNLDLWQAENVPKAGAQD